MSLSTEAVSSASHQDAKQTATGTSGQTRSSSGTRRRRKPPSPNSILDEKAFRRALDEAGLVVKPIHLDAFHQALHRQHYPDLPTFVENYERHEQQSQKHSNNTDSHNLPSVGPLKNAVSNRKNRNKVQLPKPLLHFLRHAADNGFVTVTSRVAQHQTSADGMTTKLAVQLHDGQLVESVLMRYLSHDGSRASLCVSSQCGCAMGCTFCATGTMGLSGNLTAGEILEQMVHADRLLAREWHERWHSQQQLQQGDDNESKTESSNNKINLDLVRNVVFMGMGEPLDNYSNVVEACRALIDRKRWNLAHGRVTVSTVGLVSQIRKLTRELPEVSLALSLHAPNQALRTAIVPTATRYPIQQLIEALDEHMMAYLQKRKRRQTETASAEGEYTVEERIKESSRRRAMIEYVMLEGDTSTLECAHELGKLCENRHLVVNLIPYNATNVKDKLQCPSWEHMKAFQNIVSSYGTFCTIRRTMGADIDSACGQLITLHKKEEEKKDSVGDSTADASTEEIRDIEDAATQSDRPKRVSFSRDAVAKKTSWARVVDGAKKDHLQKWILPLSVATAASAVCFLVTTTIFLKQSSRRR